jgi:hypothetical protein
MGFVGFIAMILGGYGAYEIRQSHGQKNGMPFAIAGIVTGALAVLGGLLVLLGLAAWFFWA